MYVDIDTAAVLVANHKPEEVAALIATLVHALNAADNGLRGEYPWYIHGKATQKEAREMAGKIVTDALHAYHVAVKSS